MSNVWPAGPTGTGRIRNRGGTALPTYQVPCPLSTVTVRLLLVLTLTVTNVLQSTRADGLIIPATKIGEHDYSGAIQDLEIGCINRCPDQVGFVMQSQPHDRVQPLRNSPLHKIAS
uniref:Uncharacterized protein n=1 Tax=Anopheles culicifacies TaxID=139723 RepID=A0A182LUX3_9DIPT